MESRLGWGGVLLLLLARGWRHHTWLLRCRWGQYMQQFTVDDSVFLLLGSMHAVPCIR